MKTFRTLLEDLLIDIRDRRLAEPPRERVTLSPVWVLPIVMCADVPDRRRTQPYPALAGKIGNKEQEGRRRSPAGEMEALER
jgi:hypothetical protein